MHSFMTIWMYLGNFHIICIFVDDEGEEIDDSSDDENDAIEEEEE